MRIFYFIPFAFFVLSCTSKSDEKIIEFRDCLGSDMSKVVLTLKENMYAKLEKTYGLGTKEDNLRKYCEDRSKGSFTLVFDAADCDILKQIDSYPLEDKWERNMYDTVYMENGGIISIVGRDTNESIEIRPLEVTKEMQISDFKESGYKNLVNAGQWLECLKTQSEIDKFLSNYLMVREATGEMSEQIFAKAMTELDTNYFTENPIAELVVMRELYYKELKRNKC